MKRHWLFFVAGLLLTSGCVPSLHPFYAEEDLVFEPALIGQWTERDKSKPFWHFAKATKEDPTGKGYVLTDAGPNETRFSAHLFRLGDSLYLDMVPAKPETGTTLGGLHGLHYLPAHTLMKVYKLGDSEYQWGVMMPPAVEKLLKESPDALKHETVDGRIVLTASTQELRKFLQAHSGQEDLFSKPTVMYRVKEKSE